MQDLIMYQNENLMILLTLGVNTSAKLILIKQQLSIIRF